MRYLMLFALVLGCTSDKSKQEPAPSQPAAAAWSKRETADCPAYPGRSKVVIDDVDGGYAVTITTEDTTSISTIREHAKYVVGAAAANAGADALKFDRAIGDRTKNCPVILDGTTIDSEEQPGGVKITVKAKDGSAVDGLRKAARDRAESLAAMREAMRQ
jgi:hypothetical protein